MIRPVEEYISNIRVCELSRGKRDLKFRLENVHPSVANGIRRSVLSETSSMAIEYVFIRQNSSVIPDEMLSHRLSLVVLDANPGEFESIEEISAEEGVNYEDIKDKVSSKTGIFMRLCVANSGEGPLTVYSDSIEVIDQGAFDSDQEASERRGRKHGIVKEGILLCKLAPRQRIEAKMVAMKGAGRTHAKWSPVSLCTYRYKHDISVIKHLSKDRAAEARKYFRGKGFSTDGGQVTVDGDSVIVNQDLFSTDLADAFEVRRYEDAFLFEIETLSLDARDVLLDGLAVLKGRATRLRESLAEDSK